MFIKFFLTFLWKSVFSNLRNKVILDKTVFYKVKGLSVVSHNVWLKSYAQLGTSFYAILIRFLTNFNGEKIQIWNRVGVKMRAVILLGGPNKGTRFRPLSLDIPKPLFPVGGIPILQQQVFFTPEKVYKAKETRFSEAFCLNL